MASAKRTAWQWARLYVAVIIGVVWTLVPVLWMLSIAIRPRGDLFRHGFSLIPKSPTLDNIIDVILNRTTVPAHLEQGFLRTLIVAVPSTVLAVILASLAAYSLARFRFRGREPYGILLLVTQMMPAVLFIVPLFIIMRSLDLINTASGLILSYLTFALPFSIWMLRGYFENIPTELEDAARVDGCNRLQAIRHVVLPLAAPALVAVAAFIFILSWNEFLFAFILAGESPLLTVQLYAFKGQYGPEYEGLMAASLLVAAPPVIMFVLAQRYLVRGLTAGGIK